jgi:hypothetical protein
LRVFFKCCRTPCCGISCTSIMVDNFAIVDEKHAEVEEEKLLNSDFGAD